VKKTIAAVVVALSVLTACGSSSKSAKSATTTTPAATPKRIVSMSPNATEMLFAIGAGKQVIGVDDQSNYPAGVPKTSLSAYTPNVEAIAGYKPDMVVIAGDTKDLKASLEKLSIPVVDEEPAKTIDDSYKQITDLGTRTGHSKAAAALVTSMKDKITSLTKDLPKRTKALTYYHELDNTLYSVTSKTFIGQVYSLAGLQNIADPADADGSKGGYPQLSAEYLVKADPDFVFLADTKCCQQTAATFGARPAFGALKAVKDNHVVLFDDDIASRWGPRIVDLLAQVVAVVKAQPAA
jgi:iron complex transport system substrate-binding protein